MAPRSKLNWLKPVVKPIKNKLVDQATLPKLLGELPKIDPNTPVFYVVEDTSFSELALIRRMAELNGLPDPKTQHSLGGAEFKTSVISLSQKPGSPFAHPKALFDLVRVCSAKNLPVLLIPVNVFWGRAPIKEDSLLRLLTAQNWGQISTAHRVLDLLTKRGEIYVEFDRSYSLNELLEPAQSHANKAQVAVCEAALKGILKQQRMRVIGPDLSDRRTEVEAILNAEQVKRAVGKRATEENLRVSEVRQVAREYALEIATDYKLSIIRAFEIALNWLWDELFHGIQVHGFNGIRELAQDHEVVYLPCHRSHVDYLLVMFVLYKRGLRTPYVAAGDNLNAPIIGPILRSGGAFFMRRSFGGDALYTSVFREYMQSILRRGIPLKFFIEGGRTRSGHLLPAKTGLLSMVVDAALKDKSRPVIFVPVYIGYERTVEASSYIKEMQGKPKKTESVFSVIKTLRTMERIFGEVHVSFAKPFLLSDMLRRSSFKLSPEQQKKAVSNATTSAAELAMSRINQNAVVAPVNLSALCMLSAPKLSASKSLLRDSMSLYTACIRALPAWDQVVLTELSVSEVIDHSSQLGLLDTQADHYVLNADQQALLTISRNNVLHLAFIPSVVALNLEAKEDQLAKRLAPVLKLARFMLFIDLGEAALKQNLRQLKRSGALKPVEQSLELKQALGFHAEDVLGMLKLLIGLEAQYQNTQEPTPAGFVELVTQTLKNHPELVGRFFSWSDHALIKNFFHQVKTFRKNEDLQLITDASDCINVLLTTELNQQIEALLGPA